MKRLAFALMALAGCSTDTFTGGGDSATDGPTTDARDDGGTTGEGGSCATSPVCSSVEQCNAFDTPEAYPPFFDLSQAPGALAFSTDQSVSCPRSVAATISASGVNGARAALSGSKAITNAVGAHARIEMDVLLPKTVTGGSTFLVLYANKDAAGSGVALESSNGQWNMRVRATNAQKSVNPRVGAWNHVALDVTFSAANNLGQATFEYTDASGSKQSTSITDSTLPGGTATFSELAFTAGIVPFATLSAPMTTYMDDVVFTPQ
jgi:hypothetical protein